jgi:toxin-antitoxin system PIN domain toxin
MIAVDTNLLIYAHREELVQHHKARQLLEQLAEGKGHWAIPVFCLGEFLRVMTHVRLWEQPFSASEACMAINNILASPSLRVLMPGSLYVGLFLELIESSQVTGNLLFDAQIAALCLEHGVSCLVTEDRDFDRFKKLYTRRL